MAKIYLSTTPYQRRQINKLLAIKKPGAAIFGQFFRDGFVVKNLSIRSTVAIRKLIFDGRGKPSRFIRKLNGLPTHPKNWTQP